MEFRVLAPIEVSEGGRVLALGGHRQRMVLAVLLVHANHVVSTDALIDAVWGEAPPASARKTLQAYVSLLRKTLHDGLIEAVEDGYVLQAAPKEIDAEEFESLEGRLTSTT